MKHVAALALLLVVSGCVAITPTPTASSGDRMVLVAPPEGVYVAAFPDMGGGEDDVTAAKIKDFEDAVGKPIAWTYFSNNWYDKIAFPKADVETIYAAGSVPFIRLMARSRGRNRNGDSVYSMQAILSGTFDADLRQWARDARDVGRPVLAEFGTEVNGEWFPWNGKWNGGAATDAYGDLTLPDGPERFRDAFRHIIDICREEGAANITWFFHIDAGPSPEEPWNAMANYYPGDDYIDWIGISVYGSQRAGREWRTFSEKLDRAYGEICGISSTKPLAVIEYAVIDDPAHDKPAWIRDALGAVRSGRYTRIKALSYWNEAWDSRGTRVDLRANSSPASLAAYRDAIAEPFFVPKLEFAAVPLRK
jgi:hypothetical protein